MDLDSSIPSECQEEHLPLPLPLPQPLPYPSSPPSKFSKFMEEVKERVSSPKKTPNSKARSKIFDHLNQSIPDSYESLFESTHKITAKHISQLRYYKELPKTSENIALCFLLLLDLPVPKSHYWEQFVLFLTRPGMFLQLLRHLPFYLETGCCPKNLAKVAQVFNKIPAKELKLDPKFFELQLLLNVLKETLASIKIPEIPEQVSRKIKIPLSTKAKTSKVSEFLNETDVLKSYDAGVLQSAVETEAKQLRVLKGKLSKEEWNEKRWQKNEEKMEQLRDNEREIDILRNTENEFFRKVEKERKEKKIIENAFKNLEVSENRNIKKNCKKQEISEISKKAEENYASMVWDQQLAKAKEMQYRADVQQCNKIRFEDRRDYYKLEYETAKNDQKMQRTESLNNSLKMQYKSLIQEKEKVLKALSLYSSN